MELSRFQITELFKILFWIIVVTVPIGLYYIYYSEIQNQYDNQRNFRALNEVSSQLELHFQALDKLFLFTPVDSYNPEKKNNEQPEGLKKQLEALEIYKRRLQTNNFFQDLQVKEIVLNDLAKNCEGKRIHSFFIDNQAAHPNLKVYPCNKVPDESKKPDLKTKTIYFELPIKSVLGSELPLDFDEILLSNNKGDVIFQKGSKVLEWTDKKTFLEKSRQGNSIANINWLLREASEQIKISHHATEKDNTATATTTATAIESFINKLKHIDLPLEHSTYVDLSIAGNDYRIYIHPFVIANTIHNLDKNLENPYFNKLYAVGIVKKDRLGGSVLSLPFIYFSVALLLLLLGFLSWPFLRLKFMGPKESISANDLQAMLLSPLFGLVIITLFLLTIFTFFGLEDQLDEEAGKIAETIRDNFRNDLTKVFHEMDSYMNVYRNKGFGEKPPNIDDCERLDTTEFFWSNDNYETDLFSCLVDHKASEKDQTSTFPDVRDIFVVDNQGRQYGPIIFFVERLYSSTRLKVDFRDYFKNPRDGRTWHWHSREDNSEAQPFYIERIHNFSDGNKASQVAMPMRTSFEKSIAKMGENTPVVMASTTYFPSIAAPVLPASFHFAIIENASGDILYHSEDEKSFVENLYAESDYNHHLISHTQMGFNGLVEGLYHGDATKFFVLPLPDIPWSVVVYYDLDRLHVLMVKTAVITFLSFTLYLLPVLFLFIFFTKIVIKDWDWLWPHHLKSYQYTELIFMLVLFSVIHLLYVMFVSGWTLFASLILSVPFLFLIVWIFIGDRPHKNNFFHWMFWICCLILLLSLFPKLNAIQEKKENLSFIELAQTIPLEQWMIPIALILLIITPLILPRLFWEKLFRQEKHSQFIFWGYSFLLLGPLIVLLYRLFDPNYNLWYFQVFATVVLIILLIKYIFFPDSPMDNKGPNSQCPKNCIVKYICFITLIYLPLAVIPTIGFFKDTFSINQTIYARMDQMHFADNMQKRVHMLDRYARMFYPSDFDKPDNKQKRLILDDPENTKTYGIYGFTRNDSQGIYRFTRNDSQINDASSEGSINNDCSDYPDVQRGPTDYFLKKLLDIDLRFAQQHVLNLDKSTNLDKPTNDVRCWKEQLLNFTTEDSAGVIRNQISQQAPELWSLIQPRLPRLEFIMLLFLIGISWWWLLSYFSRKLFALYIPEPKRGRNSLADQQINSGLYPFNILIRGVDNEFLSLLQNSGVTVNPAKDIHYLNILTMDFDDLQGYKKILVVDNLDTGIQDPGRRKQALEYLEKQVNRQSGQRNFIFLRCEIAPLYRLTNPKAYPYFRTTPDATSSQPDIEEINRWSKLLAKFKKHYCWEPPLENTSIIDAISSDLSEQQRLIQFVRAECRVWPELGPIGQELESIILDDSSESLNMQKALEYIRTHGNVFFRKRWELCTRDERLCLCQLAEGQFINPANELVIEHLYRRGYIKRAPYFRIASEAFKNFVGTAELIENPENWATEASKSVWSRLRIPLFIILFCLTGVLLYIASDALDVTLGLLSGLLAFIPLLLRGVNTMKDNSSAS